MLFQIMDCSAELGNCCGDPGFVLILESLRRIVSLIQLIAPILLIVCASIEFSKSVMNPDRKGGLSRIKNMFLGAAVVFFVPIIVNAFMNILPRSFSLSDCWQKAKTVSESANRHSFQYVSPYESKPSSSFIINPGEYEKGKPKPKPSPSSGTGDGGSTGGGSIAPGDAKGILEGAEKVHTMYEQNRWAYYSDLGQLRWNDIKYSTNNPSRMTCCATFVGSAFYVGGVFTESEINKYNYNSQYGISELCQAHGWTKITSYGQLAAGDVVIMSGPSGGSAPGHVQIYAGNGTWYNAGSTNAIQRDNPYSSDASARFLWAWRKPA